jgi:hypothetical protein
MQSSRRSLRLGDSRRSKRPDPRLDVLLRNGTSTTSGIRQLWRHKSYEGFQCCIEKQSRRRSTVWRPVKRSLADAI